MAFNDSMALDCGLQNIDTIWFSNSFQTQVGKTIMQSIMKHILLSLRAGGNWHYKMLSVPSAKQGQLYNNYIAWQSIHLVFKDVCCVFFQVWITNYFTEILNILI